MGDTSRYALWARDQIWRHVTKPITDRVITTGPELGALDRLAVNIDITFSTIRDRVAAAVIRDAREELGDG